MLALHDAIGPRIVSRYPNVSDAILVRQPVKRSDISRTVVRHNLRDSTPAAEDLLKNESANSVAGLHL